MMGSDIYNSDLTKAPHNKILLCLHKHTLKGPHNLNKATPTHIQGRQQLHEATLIASARLTLCLLFPAV